MSNCSSSTTPLPLLRFRRKEGEERSFPTGRGWISLLGCKDIYPRKEITDINLLMNGMKSTLFAISRPALVLAAGLWLLSCTKEEGEDLLVGTDPVCFEVVDGWSESAAEPDVAAFRSDVQSRERSLDAIREENAGAEHPMYLEAVVTEGVPGRPQAVTRGVQIEDEADFYDSFGVSAYAYSGEWNEQCKPNLMYNVRVSRNAASDRWVPDGRRYFWPKNKEWVRFFAYAPYQLPTGAKLLSKVGDGGIPKIRYKVPADVNEQIDLLIATPDAVRSEEYDVLVYPGRGMPLTFRHALTAIQFRVKSVAEQNSGRRIRRIRLADIPTTGDCTMQPDAEGGLVWEIARGTAASRNTYTFDLDVPLAAGQQITEGDQTLMMFPHTIQADLYIYVWLNGENLDETAPHRFSIHGQTWPIGKTVTYAFSM